MKILHSTSSDFIQRIEKHPSLLKRFEQLLAIVKNSTGDRQKTSEAERDLAPAIQGLAKRTTYCMFLLI